LTLKILVTGLLPFDSGKTEFILSLIDQLVERGLKPGYFKPVAGHDMWYQHDTILYTLETRVLIGHDAYIVSSKLGLKNLVHIVNPFDILTFPIDPVKLNYSMVRYFDHMDNVFKRAVLSRLTIVKSGVDDYRNIYYVCSDILNLVSDNVLDVYNSIVNSIDKNRSVFVHLRSRQLEEIMSYPKIYDLIDNAIRYLERDVDVFIIEGYNDVASPTYASLNVDIVFVVSPSVVLVYDGSRYREAVNVLSYKGYPWSVKTSRVVELLRKPLMVFNIPVKIHVERLRKVYEDIVNYLFSKYYIRG